MSFTGVRAMLLVATLLIVVHARLGGKSSQDTNDIDFVVGNFNDTACPAASLAITNAETCKTFARQLANKCTESTAVDGYQSECENTTDRPVWCARQAGCSQADTGCVIFTSGTGGLAYAPYARPVCRASFVVGHLGDTACPTGSVPITSVATCKSYAHQLSSKCTEASAVDGYQSECESNTNRPVWCERQAGCSRADTGCVIYNNESGKKIHAIRSTSLRQ